ncbi:RNA polymerase sigma factor [Dethiobacter alkaliphilus]|uniref:RNA polymerase sigma factor n=1 Tax=Dethiobacter alkaliphilus TaxID=427926 RepID=UPI002227AC22|nr:sigma-70 family RNA polymerase sigma factor [Dethiobacter alkaliphilus]MCW3491661.1 sigma-70 family RNA polymerase sigma factor [Dethiobacter alkaliphilus]
MDDRELHHLLVNEDATVLEKLIDLYGDTVYKLVVRIIGGCGNIKDVEDCCSDAFVKVWEKRNQFNPDRGNLRTWVLILARYCALDYRRKFVRKSEKEASEPVSEDDWLINHDTPEELFLEKEGYDQIRITLEKLPESEKELLYRRYFLEESIETIAADLGLSRGAVDSRLWRARRSLKESLVEQDIKVVPLNG